MRCRHLVLTILLGVSSAGCEPKPSPETGDGEAAPKGSLTRKADRRQKGPQVPEKKLKATGKELPHGSKPEPAPVRSEPQRVSHPESVSDESLLERSVDVRVAAFSPDGKKLVTGYHALRALYLWDLSGKASPQRLEVVPSGKTACLSFLPDGRRLLVGEWNGFVTLYDLEAGRAVWRKRMFDYQLDAFALTGDGQTVLAVGIQERPLEGFQYQALRRSWRLGGVETGEPAGRVSAPDSALGLLGLSADGELALSLGDTEGTKTWAPLLWRVPRGEVVREFRDIREVSDLIRRPLALALDGRLVLLCRLVGTGEQVRLRLVLWDVTSGRERFTLEDPVPPIRTRELLAWFTGDSRDVVAWVAPDLVQTWDIRTGKRRWAVRLAAPAPPKSAPLGSTARLPGSVPAASALSADGRRLFLGAFGDGPRRGRFEKFGGTNVPVCVWDTFNGELLYQREHPADWREPQRLPPKAESR